MNAQRAVRLTKVERSASAAKLLTDRYHADRRQATARFTGWLFTTDRFWGIAWVEELHSALGFVLLPLLALHIGGVIFTSIRQRENLAAAMVHGRKRVSGE